MRAEAAEWNRRRLDAIDQELPLAIGEERAALIEERRLLLKGINRRDPAPVKKTPQQLDAEIAQVLSRDVAQPRSKPGDPPELWSDQELEFEIGKYLRRGPTSLKATRRFGEMMDEAIARRQATSSYRQAPGKSRC